MPYLVEFDNYGVSNQPGQAKADGGQFNWIWGYDEIITPIIQVLLFPMMGDEETIRAIWAADSA